MRQIKDEFKQNPFQVARVRGVEEQLPEGAALAVHNAWVHNKQVEMAHKFCVAKTGVNLKKGAFEEAELATLKFCLQKYQGAFKIYSQEARVFNQSIADMEEQGIGRFDHLNH